jgi:hypothetical protein
MSRSRRAEALHGYLSKSSIVVTGNFRLKRGLILTTLTIGPTESGQIRPSSSWAFNGRTTNMAKAAKKPAAKKAAKKPAAKKKK